MKRYVLVALGGTFDLIHRGHMDLLRRGFEISSKVIIGLASDEFARGRGKRPLHSYQERLKSLETVIEKNFKDPVYEISKLDTDFGPAVLEKGLEALIVSEETAFKGVELNRLRRIRNSPEVDIIVVPMTLAKDGKRISTTRIRNSEIDEDGNILRIDK
ncbi:MAG: pantetheine-phosphate adenylyltransferase [Thaumarchaeota archaeon]|nr:pantetheine-phosphate adenylyltransferase [Nitrososphaerota archaeon]